MKKPIKDILDLDEYTITEELPPNNYTTLTIAQKKNSPNPKYLCKTFKLNCNTSKAQKTVIETFYQINNQKYQYLQCYNHYSFLSFKLDWNPTFSMKYISSTTLDDILKRKNTENKWKLSDALNCLFAVAEGVGYLHDHIVYHGNLCPSNIIVDAANQCYVCDFGLYPIKNLYIKPREVVNKDYRAPEMNVYEPTSKCDVYSYGVLMCHVGLVFLKPKNIESLHDFLTKDDKTKFNFLPSFLTDLIMKCLSQNPLERPSFRDIRDHFQNSKYILGSSSISALYTEFKKSIYIKNLAEKGDTFALNKLGNMYAEGKGIQKDDHEAMKCYKKAALRGNSDAQANYGVSLQEDSEQTPTNLIEGAKFLKLSADQGNVHGMANYAMALSNGDGVEKNEKEAEKYLKMAADLGYKYAQANYGYNLINSENPTPEQVQESLKYTKKAIDQGYADGYFIYGILLLWGGSVVKKDEKLAHEYFKIAADLGYEKAMIEYAHINYSAVPPNYEIALKYYTMAYEKGCVEIKPKIDELTQKINKQSEEEETTTTSNSNTKNNSSRKISRSNSKQLNKNYSLTKKKESSKTTINIKLPKSAQIPDFDENTPSNQLLSIFKHLEDEFIRLQAMEKKLKLSSKDISHYRIFKYEDRLIQTNDRVVIYKYGKLYYNISNSRPFREKALNYIRMSADLDYDKAQVKYGVALQSGRDIKKNLKVGLNYLEKAAEQGNVKGMNYYGLALFNGDGIKANKEFGLDYLKIAADENYPEAQLNYGICVNDHVIGHQYIEKAANANYEKAIFYYATDFMEGRGVKKDFIKAAEILRGLYENIKSIEALINLIECLKHIDKEESDQYLKILADQDDPDYINHIHKAQFRYGIKLFYGDGVPRDEEMAFKYIMKSTLVGKIRSKFPEIFAKLPHDFSSVEENVNSFLRRNNGIIDPNESRIVQSAYNGDINDMLEVAKMINKTDDHRTANFFFELAADSNQVEASYIIGKFYLEGKNGLQTNITKGNNYIKRAAELGYTEAKYEVIVAQMRLIKNKSIDDDLFNELYDDICEIAADNYLPAMLLKSKYLIKKGKFDDAKEELGIVLQKYPNDSKILFKVGKLLLKINNDDQFALQLIELSTKDEIKATYFLGKYYFEKRSESIENLKNAISYLRKAAGKKIKNSQRLLDMCKIEFDRSKKDNPNIDENLQIQKPEGQIDVFDPPEVNSFEIMKNLNKDPESIFSITSIIGLQQMTEENSIKAESNEKQQQQNDSFIDLSLPNDELIKKGEQFQEKKNYIDAFQCFEAVAIRGEPIGYFKCAEVCKDMDKKLQYYQIAILNNIDGAFRGWRKCIFDYVARNKDSLPLYANKFLDQNDFSDAAILFQKAKDNSSVEYCFQKAVQNIQEIKDGMQQFDFGVFLEQRKEIDLAFSMFNKAFENGIEQADKKIKELSKFKRSQLKRLNQTDSFLEQGICYFEGKDGNPVDMNKALSNLTKASDIGCPKADFYLGKYYQRVDDLSQAIFYTEKAANAGDSDGQNSYGDYLRLGIGVDKDLAQAIEYYKLSACQGNVLGEFNYGREILLGSFPDEIKEEGIAFLKKAADEQHPDAMYYYSIAIKESDPDESNKYLQKSVQEGSEIAIEKYGQNLEDEEIYEEAAQLYKSAAERGLLIGYKKYAEFIINGYTIDGDDLDLARKYMKKVADLGDSKDQFDYAEFLYQNFLDDSIEERAIYFKKSAQKGYPKAFFRYAECLQNGDGVEQDLNEARKYYTQSFKEDPDSPTHYNLKRLKQQGLIDC